MPQSPSSWRETRSGSERGRAAGAAGTTGLRGRRTWRRSPPGRRPADPGGRRPPPPQRARGPRRAGRRPAGQRRARGRQRCGRWPRIGHGTYYNSGACRRPRSPGKLLRRPDSTRGPAVPPPPIFETTLRGATPLHRGKVRDLYAVDDHLLIVATDRISAYDVVLDSAIPDKGKVLTQLSAFWFARTGHIVPNHMVSTDPASYPAALRDQQALLAGRSMLVRRTKPVLIDVRGAGLPLRLRLEGVPRDRARVRDRAAVGTAGIGSPAGADLHAGHQGGDRARHQHQRERSGGPRRTRPGHPVARRDPRAVRARCRSRRILRDHRRGHQVRVRPSSERSPGRRRRVLHPHRRGADPRLVPILAGRPVLAGRPPAELRQAVRGATTSTRWAGTASRRPPPCRPPSSTAPARSTGRRIACWRAGSSTDEAPDRAFRPQAMSLPSEMDRLDAGPREG